MKNKITGLLTSVSLGLGGCGAGTGVDTNSNTPQVQNIAPYSKPSYNWTVNEGVHTTIAISELIGGTIAGVEFVLIGSGQTATKIVTAGYTAEIKNGLIDFQINEINGHINDIILLKGTGSYSNLGTDVHLTVIDDESFQDNPTVIYGLNYTENTLTSGPFDFNVSGTIFDHDGCISARINIIDKNTSIIHASQGINCEKFNASFTNIPMGKYDVEITRTGIKKGINTNYSNAKRTFPIDLSYVNNAPIAQDKTFYCGNSDDYIASFDMSEIMTDDSANTIISDSSAEIKRTHIVATSKILNINTNEESGTIHQYEDGIYTNIEYPVKSDFYMYYKIVDTRDKESNVARLDFKNCN